MIGYTLLARDDRIGSVDDFYFDDSSWKVRYLVAETGKWLPGRLILLSPVSIGEPNWGAKVLPMELTREQIEDSPGIDRDMPVSRRRELELNQYFNWPVYWAPGAAFSPVAQPVRGRDGADDQGSEHDDDDEAVSSLRSADEVTGYHIKATDGEIGHVEDLLVDDEEWVIRYLVVDTRNWLPGRKVIVSPQWIEKVSWDEKRIFVDIFKDLIESGPEYDPDIHLNRDYEEQLYELYGKAKYWESMSVE